uniref:EF-hand domain-containing protein n=1 Tax=Heligmosomoides polygyrus TaxID=6339 RepID=A0A183FYA7_HELPZ
LKEKELRKVLDSTPSFRSGNKALFRSLDQNGIISYSEYIFLLTLMTKSKSSFKIAFLMFDKDDNERIDRDEFLLKSEEEVKKQDTTLLLHFFGIKGNKKLSFEEFRNFYQNLQEEIMEIEFHEFARGKSTISPMDFARLVLRYTVVHKDDYHKYINRVKERSSPDDMGVSLRQWAGFSLFLNNLEEFSTAVRLYANADMPVSPPEFSRAVQTTIGEPLDPYVVSLIYRIFDANDDQTLSYPEFLAVMNDRLHRGLKGRLDKPWGWGPFKKCVINELSRY